MSNFKADILDAVGDKEIIAIKIIDTIDGYPFNKHDTRFRSGNLQVGNVLLDIPYALSILDYEYINGYGAQDCHSIYIWT